jgi:hypothetical protein
MISGVLFLCAGSELEIQASALFEVSSSDCWDSTSMLPTWLSFLWSFIDERKKKYTDVSRCSKKDIDLC